MRDVLIGAKRTSRVARAAAALGVFLLGLAIPSAQAGERKFMVILASSPKQFPDGGVPGGGFANRTTIDRAYFDQGNNNGIDSFAEYWEEISYGDVTVSGSTFGWIDLPWAMQPPLVNPNRHTAGQRPPTGDRIEDRNLRISPSTFYDLNSDGHYEYGFGEEFLDLASTIVDTTGNPGGDDDGPYAVGLGTPDLTERGDGTRIPVWTPGERFVDIDEDEKWDGFDELNNQMDWNFDMRPDNPGPWIDLNGDNEQNANGVCDCSVPGGPCYLPDSDNDGLPDCCPNGPPCPIRSCPPNTYEGTNGTFLDCNGNGRQDAIDVAMGSSKDVWPCKSIGETCPCNTPASTTPDGIPDECQFANSPTSKCGEPGGGTDDGCSMVPVCEVLVTQPFRRCEFFDANTSGGIDVVEPFENFMRRWDPCLLDGDRSPENIDNPQAHWIKIYDPFSLSAGSEQSCFSPEYSVDYADPSYILNNYPGDAQALVDKAGARILFGSHDPLNVLSPSATCLCNIGFNVVQLTGALDCCPPGPMELDQTIAIGDRLCTNVDLNGNGSISANEKKICVRIVPVFGGPCKSILDLDLNDRIDARINPMQDPRPSDRVETRLCIAGAHAQFDPSDDWVNVVQPGPGGTMFHTSKMQALGGTLGFDMPFATFTPEPGTFSPLVAQGERGWYQQAWEDRYGDECFDTQGQTTTCSAPSWPDNGGFQNVPIMKPYIETDPDKFDPETDRRYFHANWGGLNGDGTGWIGGAENRFLRFETGVTVNGFEEELNHPILPDERDGLNDAPTFYDGWVEHDDLPSSKYHQAGDQWLGEITGPFRSYYGLVDLAITQLVPDPPEGANERFNPDYANVDEVHLPAIWGDDRGSHNPNVPQLGPDGVTAAAGPYATKVHGALGRDGGNVLTMEMLTWRTDGTHLNNGRIWEHFHGFHPYAGPRGANLGFRDYNLDGLIDMGETRPAGSDNYLADPFIESEPNTGTSTAYPWNRQRMLEDCIAVLDDSGVDFDDFVDSDALSAVECIRGGLLRSLAPPPFLSDVALQTHQAQNSTDVVRPNGVCSGIVLLPAGAAKVGNEGDDFPRAPSFYPIHNEDGVGADENESNNFPRTGTKQISWNIFFHDLVSPLDNEGEAGTGQGGIGDAQVSYSAHEYLHSWEGFPDLYDYDVFQSEGAQENCPVGGWDIMANGGVVHPNPYLKSTQCTGWLEPIDLATVLTPGVSRTLTLPSSEFVRDESHYYLENENRAGERFYFWSVGSGFDRRLPGDGLLIMHTDLGPTFDSEAPQQRAGTPYTYAIVQADGNDNLGPCENRGDGGDPWPGFTFNQEFNCDTFPSSRWYNGNACSGLSISEITPDNAGSIRMTVNWTPTSIPNLRFLAPPGGESVGSPPRSLYSIDTETTDSFGGTWLRFFYTPSESNVAIRADGSNYIGTAKKNGPGSVSTSVDWNVSSVPDGRYFIFAELLPGKGADNMNERKFTTPRPGRNNEGNGTLTVQHVNTNELVGSGQSGTRSSDGLTFTAFNQGSGTPVDFSALQVVADDQLSVQSTQNRVAFLRVITGIEANGTRLRLNAALPSTFGAGPWQIVRKPKTARSETWRLECANPAGTEWKVFSTLTQPEPPTNAPNRDPHPHAMNGVPYTSLNGAVTFTVMSGTQTFRLGDTFSFVTTGISAPSRSVAVVRGRVSQAPAAFIIATPISGPPPLRVTFDGRDSIEPNGEPLQYRWDFGDGSPAATGATQIHTFNQARTFTVVLRATNARTGLFDEALVDIAVTNNSPNASLRATPSSGQAPLDVRFDASSSTDTESSGNELIYQWDFGDGENANRQGIRGSSFAIVDHLFTRDTSGRQCTSQLPCTFIVTLTVTDTGGKQDVETITIVVGNTRPVVNISASPVSGSVPLEVTFNGLNSSDADGDPITIKWFFGDGLPGVPDATLPRTGMTGRTDGNVTHTYRLRTGDTTGTSTYTATAIVEDNRGSSTTWAGTMIVVSQAVPGASEPRSVFTISPNPPHVGQVFSVDGTRSFDRPAGGRITSYDWNWGDNTPHSTGATATHTYAQPGSYSIALTVADGETPALTNRSTQTVIVGVEGDDDETPSTNRPPTASFTVSATEGAIGDEITFDAGASVDPDGDSVTFEWSFGDGTSDTGSQVTHSFSRAGSFLVRLTVTDEFNASTDGTRSITIQEITGNRPPVAVIATAPRSATAPAALSFDARNSYDLDNDTLTFTWEFMRNGQRVGGLENGALVTRRFDTPGTYTAQLTVTDGRGGMMQA
ncbi:MAG: PKD domain-containing protein, partial [Planctomycetota bacterium]